MSREVRPLQLNDTWIASGDPALSHLCAIDKGGMGEVHKINPLQEGPY